MLWNFSADFYCFFISVASLLVILPPCKGGSMRHCCLCESALCLPLTREWKGTESSNLVHRFPHHSYYQPWQFWGQRSTSQGLAVVRHKMHRNFERLATQSYEFGTTLLVNWEWKAAAEILNSVYPFCAVHLTRDAVQDQKTEVLWPQGNYHKFKKVFDST